MKTPSTMRTMLDRETIERAFDRIGSKAVRRGIQTEIAVYGGSCLVLASDMREASGDVDAVFDVRSRSALYEMFDEVARELRLPSDWMNEAVRRSAPPQPPRIPYGDYPRDNTSGCGLRVFLPTPEYMLAMKLLAQRGGGEHEEEKTQTDRSDSLALMRITGLDTKEKLQNLMETYYPMIMGMRSPQLAQRLEIKMDDLLDEQRTAIAAAIPTWTPRRGGGRDGRGE